MNLTHQFFETEGPILTVESEHAEWVISELRQRVRKLQMVIDALKDEFSLDIPREIASQPQAAGSQITIKIGQAHGTRKDQIKRYIQEHGPQTRRAIIDALGIPPGSVDAALNDKTTFSRSGTGTWGLVRLPIG